MKNSILAILLLFGCLNAMAQFQGYKFRFSNDPIVIENGDTLDFPWAGGLNAPQFNTLDINADGMEDLTLYDQSSGRMVVFLANGQGYEFNLEYSETFPYGFNGIYGWVFLRDANCDGRKDLYTKTPAGAQIYRNLNGPVNYPVWATFDPIIQYDTTINIPISEADIPAFEDVDNDGDIDLVTFEFSSGGTIDYFRNLSQERVGNCGISEFERVTRCWGRIYECQTCGKYDINLAANCYINGNPANLYCQPRMGLHAGSTMLAIDMDGDADKDLLLGDIGCSEVTYLENVGSNTFAQFDSAELGYPFNTTPINFFVFPAMFYEDVDQDGVKDLLVTPNTTDNPAGAIDLANSVHFYKNNGTTAIPSFTYIQDDFLQENMIDIGNYSSPALVDYDADGDLDLFVGNRGRSINGIQRGRLYYYENTGDQNIPEFTLVDNDFLGLFGRDVENIRPFFHDLTGDGALDIGLLWGENGGLDYELYMAANTSAAGNPMSFSTDSIRIYSDSLPRIFPGDFPKFYDFDQDGNDDLFMGISNFSYMKYYRNNGTIQNPAFSEQISDVGFIGSPLGNTQPSFEFLDYDGNGDIDMLYGDIRGRLRVYPNFINEISLGDTIDFRSNVIVNDTLSPGTPIDQKLNEFLKLACGDLNNDGKVDILLGTKTGGLHYFINESTPINGLGSLYENRKSLKVFPVPSSDVVNINSEISGELEVFDLMGKSYLKGRVETSEDFKIDLSDYKSGIYFLKLKGDKGEIYSGKMIKN